MPRHLFVPEASLAEAYANTTVSIKDGADGESISCASQPGIVALMLDQLDPQPGERVLELGTGTGYNAALLAELVGPAGHVTTIDVDEDLVDGARRNFTAADVTNVTAFCRDGALGNVDGAPYDRIIATVGAHGIPHAWLDQLAPGGRLLVPQRLCGGVSRSIAYENHDGAWTSVGSAMNTFMPLRSGIADDDRPTIPITAKGTVRLQTPVGVDVDPTVFADILDTDRTIIWAQVYVEAMESAEWIELWLTCTIPGGLNQMPRAREAIGTVLTDDPYASSTAAVTQNALAYLARRPSTRRTLDGQKLWEFGVVGHGPDGPALADRVCQSMREWDTTIRGREATFELQPLNTDREPHRHEQGVVTIDTPLNRVTITWH